MDYITKAKLERLLHKIKIRTDMKDVITELYSILSGSIRFIAFKYLHKKEDAEELIQDFWMKIPKIADGYHYSKNPFGYLIKVANNMAINRYKEINKEMPISIEYVKFSEKYRESNMFIDRQEDLANIIHIENYLEKLPLDQRKIIQIIYFEKKTIRKIAEELKMSKSEVHRQKQIGLQVLKELIEQDMEI